MRVRGSSTLMLVLMSVALVFGGCSFGREASQTVKIVGSTTVLPVISKAAELYMAIHPEIAITINPGGSGVGIASVAKGLAEIGMVSREIALEEKGNYRDVDFKVYSIGKDAVACVVSSAVYDGGVRSLSREAIRKIYLGEYRNWNQVGGPDRDILVVDKEAHRGTRHIFMRYVFDDEHARTPGAHITTGSNNEIRI